jgi:hypothetical protein
MQLIESLHVGDVPDCRAQNARVAGYGAGESRRTARIAAPAWRRRVYQLRITAARPS